jgi:hypothetical protein
VLVGEDSASVVYTRNKEKASNEVGMRGRLHRLPAETTEAADVSRSHFGLSRTQSMEWPVPWLSKRPSTKLNQSSSTRESTNAADLL